MVKLGAILEPAHRAEVVDATREYQLLGVRLEGAGPFLREIRAGAELSARTLYRVRSGDFIFSRLFAWRGAFGVIPPELDGCHVSNEFPVFVPRDGRLEPSYLEYWFHLPRVLERVSADCTGSTPLTRNRYKERFFLELTMPLPPVEEQLRAIEMLNRLATQSSRLRHLQRHVSGAIDSLLAARLNRLFGDPYHGIVGSGRFADFAPLGDLSCDVADGPHATPQYVDHGIPFVTVLNITSGRVDFRGAKHITTAAHDSYSRRAKAETGDVLVSKDGTIGVPCYVDTDRDFSFFVSVALVKPRRELLDGRFLTWVLRAPYLQDRIAERSRGDMIRHLVLREIRQLLVPAVPLAVQRRVVSELDDVESVHQSLMATSSESQNMMAAITRSALSSAFAGS
jgi:type I restriction enzyme S subunit